MITTVLTWIAAAIIVDYLSEYVTEGSWFSKPRDWLEENSLFWWKFFFCKFCIGLKFSFVASILKSWGIFGGLNIELWVAQVIAETVIIHWISQIASGAVARARMSLYNLERVTGQVEPRSRRKAP